MTPDQQRHQNIIDFKMTFDSEHGKRVLERLSILCHENRPTFVDHNALGSAYKEGARSVILHIRSMLSKDATKDISTQVINEREL